MPPATAAPSKAADIVEWAHDRLGLTWGEVGDVLKTTGRTVQRWRDGDAAPGRTNEARLDALDEFRFWLRTVFEGDEDAAREWLDTRLLDLNGKTPLHALKAGKIAKVTEFLATYHAGAFI